MSKATIENWWEQRLFARFPLNPKPGVWVKGYDYRDPQGRMDTWPHSVARMSLYEDYQRWCEEQEILQVEEQLMFFLTIRPWLYIGANKDWHVRNYFVRQQQQFEGKWLTLKKRRYFVRLLAWEEHVAAFEGATGRNVPILQERRTFYAAT